MTIPFLAYDRLLGIEKCTLFVAFNKLRNPLRITLTFMFTNNYGILLITEHNRQYFLGVPKVRNFRNVDV